MQWAVLAAWMWTCGSPPMAGPAPSSGPSTAPGPIATRPARARSPCWHHTYRPAVQEARRTGKLLVVIFHDPTHPASQTFDEMTLSDPATRKFLARFVTVKLDATRAEGKRRLAETAQHEAPVTCVYSPQGELLDTIPGCIIPAERFRRRVACSAAYWRAATSRPLDPAAKWRAIQARLKLSTRAKAAEDIDELLRLPPKKLPKGLTPAKLHLAKGMALMRSAPKQAEASLNKARASAGDDITTSARAVLVLAELYDRTGRLDKAHEFYGLYIERFPKASDIGRAYCAKALLEWVGLNDPSRARKTLREFLDRYPDDAHAIRAKEMLDMLTQGGGKGPKK